MKKGCSPCAASRKLPVLPIITLFIFERSNTTGKICLITCQMADFFAIWPIDDFLTFFNRLAACVTGTWEPGGDLSGITCILGVTHNLEN